jgi:cytochrome c-type biogenesis protein CcsB
MSGLFLKIGYSAYLIAALFIGFAGAHAKKKSSGARIAGIFLLIGFIFHSAMIALRWYAAGRPPFASMYEALVLFAWAVVVVYLVFDRIYRARILFAPALILVLCMLTGAFFGDSAMKPLVPALQSKWISIHVVTYFIGYGALSIAFMLGILYVAYARRLSADSDQMRYIDTLIYRLIIFGFPFLTIGMTTGSAWADVAWGTYWGWDPKETCSLITWLVYAVYLHMRILRGWKDSKAAWLNIIGFLVTLFTFVGVNFILPGLHSYNS